MHATVVCDRRQCIFCTTVNNQCSFLLIPIVESCLIQHNIPTSNTFTISLVFSFPQTWKKPSSSYEDVQL